MPVIINNHTFLKALFGDQWAYAHVCAVLGDPGDRTLPRSAWSGCYAGDLTLDQLNRSHTNNYFAVSRFRLPVRQKINFVAMHVLGIDDVGPKADPVKARDLLGPPDYRLETSPGNEHWGYRLDPPLETGDAAETLQRSVRLALGLEKDPGMEGCARYLRLPVGRNGKPTAANWSTRLTHWGL